MGDSKTIIITTDVGEVTVRKLALGDYANFLRALKKLPKLILDITKNDKEKLTNEYIISILPQIAADELPEFAGVIASATDKDSDFILQLDLAETLDVADAVLELIIIII
jgi:hypothetical protein